MASIGTDFVPLERQLFALGLGEAMAALVRQRYPRDTAKRIARAWDLDPSTASNVVKGHCSERTLTKALRSEGWPLIEALGATLTGETFEQYQERRLTQLIREAADGLEKVRSLAVRREEVEARARRAVADLDRPTDHALGGAEGFPWAPLDERGAVAPRSAEEG
jgi:hypothetical protein